MCILKWSVWFALLDLVAFLCMWGYGVEENGRSLSVSLGFEVFYWAFAVIGLILAVYGFVMLIRLGARHINRTVLTVLFAMVPGCDALIGILSHLGTHPV